MIKTELGAELGASQPIEWKTKTLYCSIVIDLDSIHHSYSS